MSSERSTRLTEHYPTPGLNVRVFPYRKETPTSKAQRGYRGFHSLISPVFGNLKQCLYIINRVLLKSIPFEFLVSCSSFSLRSYHALLTRVKYHKNIEKHIRAKANGFFQDKHIQCIMIIVQK